MRIPWTLVALMLTFCNLYATKTTYFNPKTTTANEFTNTITTETTAELFTEIGIQDRLSKVDIPFKYTYSEYITKKVEQYVTAGKKDTEYILGRCEVYFPVFEHYLEKYDLPAELKYLPMIESGLRLNVRSHAGAVGLWQMMSITARHYKLTVNSYVDERHDLYRSTEAAVRMLSDMYKMFGDWSLVLAAYNSGPGRVQGAIRAAGSKQFDVVKNFLPKETQLYIPKFVAAAYIANYYKNHGLIPRIPEYNLNNTRTLHIPQKLSFREVTKVSGLDYQTIAKLNPVYLRGFIPAYEKGNFLVLPTDKVEAVRQYLESKQTADSTQRPEGKFQTTYTVKKGDSLEAIANRFQCTVEDIMAWNGLNKGHVVMNQELLLYLSKSMIFNRV